MRNRFARTLQEKSIGIHRSAPLPSWAGRTLQTWARKRGMRRPPQAEGVTRTVVFFHGCARELLRAGHGRDAR